MLKWIGAQILGGLIRWIVGSIIAAVCLLWGFAPDEWFAHLWIDPPLWLSHPITRLIVLLVGVATVMVLILLRKINIGKKAVDVQIGNQSSQLAEALMGRTDWCMNFNPLLPGRHKLISFEPDGTIGTGRNNNEHKWKLVGETLELWRRNGDLQNRYAYNHRDERYVCTNDPQAAGVPNQIIYRRKNQNGTP